MQIEKIVKSTFVKVGRVIEFVLTGQSEYRLTTAEFADHEKVSDLVTARKIMDALRIILQEKFAIRIQRPIVLELIKDEKKSEYGFYWYEGSLGKYKSQDMIDEKYHLIYVISGLRRERFKAILAHELTHAYQRETGLFTSHKGLREGLARWVEYKILMLEGEEIEAQKLLNIKHWIYGKGINRLLELERETGEKSLVAALRRIYK